MLPNPGFDSYLAPEKPAQGVGLGGTRVHPESRHFPNPTLTFPLLRAAADLQRQALVQQQVHLTQ